MLRSLDSRDPNICTGRVIGSSPRDTGGKGKGKRPRKRTRKELAQRAQYKALCQAKYGGKAEKAHPIGARVTDLGTQAHPIGARVTDLGTRARVTDPGTRAKYPTPTNAVLEGWFKMLQKSYPRAHRDDYFLHDKKQALELLKLDMEILQDYRRACEALTSQAPQSVTDPGTGQAPSDDEFDSDDESDSELRQRLGASLGGSSSSATGQGGNQPTIVTDFGTTTQVEWV